MRGEEKAGKSAASYKFPNKKELAKRLGVTVDDFHRKVKPDIKKHFSDLLRQRGIKNPDIGVDTLGNVVLKDLKTGKTILTDVPLSSFNR